MISSRRSSAFWRRRPSKSGFRRAPRFDVDGDFGDWLTFGRIVGRLTCDDVDIGEKLIEVGLAAKTKSELRSLIESTRKEAGS